MLGRELYFKFQDPRDDEFQSIETSDSSCGEMLCFEEEMSSREFVLAMNQLLISLIVKEFPSLPILEELSNELSPLARIFNAVIISLEKLSQIRSSMREGEVAAIISPFITGIHSYIETIRKGGDRERVEKIAEYVEKTSHKYYETLYREGGGKGGFPLFALYLNIFKDFLQSKKIESISSKEELVSILSQYI